MFAWDYPLRFWRISQNWQFTSTKPWGLPHSPKSNKKINKTYKTTTHQLRWWMFLCHFPKLQPFKLFFYQKFMDLTMTILPGLAGTVAQLRVLKDASLSHEELISGQKAQIESEGRQVAFSSCSLWLLWFWWIQNLVFFACDCGKIRVLFENCGNLFFCAWKCCVYVCASTYW